MLQRNTLRFGLYDAEYLLFQMPPIPAEYGRISEALATNRSGVAEDRGTIVLAMRGHSTEQNAAVLRRLDVRD